MHLFFKILCTITKPPPDALSCPLAPPRAAACFWSGEPEELADSPHGLCSDEVDEPAGVPHDFWIAAEPQDDLPHLARRQPCQKDPANSWVNYVSC